MKSGDRLFISYRLARGTRGVVSVRTFKSTTRSCSTLLCLRLCISDDGAEVGSLVRKTAVPGTLTGFDFSSILIRSSIGIESRCVLACKMTLPRDQVHIRTNIATPIVSGTRPPSTTLSRLAMKKATSMERNAPVSARAAQSGHRHSFQTTKKAREVVATIVPNTAMPQALANASDD